MRKKSTKENSSQKNYSALHSQDAIFVWIELNLS
jgi:hypothetical protein